MGAEIKSLCVDIKIKKNLTRDRFMHAFSLEKKNVQCLGIYLDQS